MGIVNDWVCEVTGARAVRRTERVQRLWSGYGEVVRLELVGAAVPSVIVKRVAPPANERGSVSDTRKRRSYDVEAAFYRTYAARCDASCRVATLIAARVTEGEWCFVLEDLDAAGFRGRHDAAPRHALEACLAWLASFHARFLGDPGDGLWAEGTYWHLATRTDELASIRDRELRAAAPIVDAQLRAARFHTILHGDPKEANFCFAGDGRVAAVDFQYTGRGCAMKDVAYLLHGHADAYLETYFARLRECLDPAVDAEAVIAEWRALFPVAQHDFRRFLAGWRG